MGRDTQSARDERPISNKDIVILRGTQRLQRERKTEEKEDTKIERQTETEEIGRL